MFAERRTRLMRSMRGGVAIFAGAREVLRNGDVHYDFRQSSTFHYLTGFDEPDAVAVLRPGHKEPFVLFVRPHDPAMEIWVGPRAGVEGAQREFGADAAFPIDDLEQELPKLLVEADTVYFSLGSDERVQGIITGAIGRRRAAPNALESIIDPAPLLASMRLIKSREELEHLQRAIDVTGAGIDAAIRATRPGMHEYEVQAVLEAEYRRSGATRLGFPSIVAGGPNSCTLHYVVNSRQLGKQDLLLLDTGAEWEYYSADVSRTFPAGGTFTPQQRAVYDIVLEAQEAGIEACQPGRTFLDVHMAAAKVVTQGLRRLKVLEGRVDKLVKDGAYRPYFMHGTSHWLGLDVHDEGPYRVGTESIELKPGMVLTVEPGVYIAPNAEAPRELRGIGVRIEDDVLITRGGHRNMSERIPRDPAVLEALAGADA